MNNLKSPKLMSSSPWPVIMVVVGLGLHIFASNPVAPTRDPDIGLGLVGLLGDLLLLVGILLLTISLRGLKKLIPLGLLVVLIAVGVNNSRIEDQKGAVISAKESQDRQVKYKALPYVVRAPANLTDDPSTRYRTPGMYGQTILYAFVDNKKSYLFVQYPTDPTQQGANICSKLPKEAPSMTVSKCELIPASGSTPDIYMGHLTGGDQTAFIQLSDSTVSLMAGGLKTADAVRILGSLQSVSYDQAFKLGIFY